MSRVPQSLIPITLQRYQDLLRYKVASATNCIKSFDLDTLTLSTFHWYALHRLSQYTTDTLHRPLDCSRRIHPSAWCDYRITHQFIGPCCLCPLSVLNSEDLVYTEAKICVTSTGTYAGEYIVECARSRCRYLGNPFPRWGWPLPLIFFFTFQCQLEEYTTKLKSWLRNTLLKVSQSGVSGQFFLTTYGSLSSTTRPRTKT